MSVKSQMRRAEARLAAQVSGPAKVHVTALDLNVLRYRITCLECVGQRGGNWSTRRVNGSNTYADALGRWSDHMEERHSAQG